LRTSIFLGELDRAPAPDPSLSLTLSTEDSLALASILFSSMSTFGAPIEGLSRFFVLILKEDCSVDAWSVLVKTNYFFFTGNTVCVS
jgi:hypothetical protein